MFEKKITNYQNIVTTYYREILCVLMLKRHDLNMKTMCFIKQNIEN